MTSPSAPSPVVGGSRNAGLLAATLWMVGVVMIGLSAWLGSLNPPISTNQTPESLLESSLWLSTWVGFGLVGALVLRKRPRAGIGWILVGITSSVGLAVLAPAYARFALVTDPGVWPLGEVAAWVATWSFFPPVLLVVALVVRFPTGVPSRLGGRVMGVFATVLAADAVVYAIRPGPIEGDTPPVNPLGVPGLRPVLDTATEMLGGALALIALVALVDSVLRFRRSQGVERLQFRWFVLAVAAFPVMFLAADLLSSNLIGEDRFDPVVVVFSLWGNGTAAAIWVAISRHGLYDIDRVISRTLSYAIITTALLGVYVGTVFLLGAFLPVEGDLPVAVATLAVAALFAPLRRRVQELVGRRFNRSRYDALNTIEGFARTVRSRGDLPDVGELLVAVTARTMEPRHMALWLRRPEGTPR